MGVPQGDVSLLETDLAQQLLGSTALARLAYTWTDGSPRVVPIWFHWTGDEIVFGSPAAAPKVAALQADPRTATTIDVDEGGTTHVLLLRGDAKVTVVGGVAAEYRSAAARYLGEEAAAGWVAGLDQPGMEMARVAVRPDWVGLIDFETRLPSALGGILA